MGVLGDLPELISKTFARTTANTECLVELYANQKQVTSCLADGCTCLGGTYNGTSCAKTAVKCPSIKKCYPGITSCIAAVAPDCKDYLGELCAVAAKFGKCPANTCPQ
eukprot:NODE_3352_length_456_cov_162.346437_g2926_i0.p2 GENE.NODE_3352_length_456_cov_162.346437_g2926_i0~~NODE_3352_length_456_cov_162.346437_g2926_i0.p2  ORF type:complete len:115 (+),score=49.63 NODE_3352_length_456_cov_162.346437_g2926_i0:24-347(+)